MKGHGGAGDVAAAAAPGAVMVVPGLDPGIGAAIHDFRAGKQVVGARDEREHDGKTCRLFGDVNRIAFSSGGSAVVKPRRLSRKRLNSSSVCHGIGEARGFLSARFLGGACVHLTAGTVVMVALAI